MEEKTEGNQKDSVERNVKPCQNHPDRDAIATCQKYDAGFCEECCHCLNTDQCCECIEPKEYCKFRHHCLIWEMSRDRRKKGINGSMRG